MALAGLGDPVALNAAVLARDPLAGISTFYGSYVLRARALAGHVDGALAVIRSYWGGMLDLGATTFWEDFDLGWLAGSGRIDEATPAGLKDLHGDYGDYCYKGFRHSLCHGWAAGPTAWLSAVVLGCVPLAPGCRRLAVRPRLGDLSWAEGTFPTPLGPVLVRHERGATGVETEVTAPGGRRHRARLESRRSRPVTQAQAARLRWRRASAMSSTSRPTPLPPRPHLAALPLLSGGA